VSTGARRATAADIVASVQREISTGALPAGSRLPPVRALDKQLGLSKNTAQAAYDELVARNLVEARCESPVYAYAKLLFESLGNELVGLHLDPFGGIDLDAWDRTLSTRPSLA
jgi:DNA-binding transcriptional MocR family regulator